MADHLVALWIRSDDDPSGIDWQAWLPKGVRVEHVQTRSFPWSDVQHEITWWITRPLTFEEWNDLDNAESEVLARIVGDDYFAGTAGPIPEISEDHGERTHESSNDGEPESVAGTGGADVPLGAARRYEEALRTIIALVPDYEELRKIADERGAEVANALTTGAWRAAEIARTALGIEEEPEWRGDE